MFLFQHGDEIKSLNADGELVVVGDAPVTPAMFASHGMEVMPELDERAPWADGWMCSSLLWQ